MQKKSNYKKRVKKSRGKGLQKLIREANKVHSKIEKYYYKNKSAKLDFQILICTFTGAFQLKLKQLSDNCVDV